MIRHEITRVRHELRRRTLTVTRVEDITPRMRRIHFTSPHLDDFASAGFDDHIKMFLSGAPTEGRPAMRDFTPRRFDAAAGTFAIDYALAHAGPATDWAKAAAPGDTLQIGGPRGSSVVPDDFDWYWLIGDETALPAIGRRLEELRPGVPVTTLVVVADAGEAQAIDTAANWSPKWLVRDGVDDGATLAAAMAGLDLPPGDGFVWIAAEAAAARAARAAVTARGHPSAWLKAAGYWQHGDADAHIRIED